MHLRILCAHVEKHDACRHLQTQLADWLRVGFGNAFCRRGACNKSFGLMRRNGVADVGGMLQGVPQGTHPESWSSDFQGASQKAEVAQSACSRTCWESKDSGKS